MKYVPVELLHVFLNMGDRRHEIGRLALANKRIYFEYAPEFQATGLAISPYKLPLRAGAHPMPDSVLDGLLGVCV